MVDLVDVAADEDTLKFGKLFNIVDPKGVQHKGMVQSIDKDGRIRAVIEEMSYVQLTPEEYEEYVVK